MQAATQRLLVQANIGVLPDCNAFLQECLLSVTHTYRIEQEYKAKAPNKTAAKSVRLVRSCIRAWISAFKRFAKLMSLEHLKLKIHAVDRKGNYDVAVVEKEVKDEAGGILAQYLECGEYLNVPSAATMQLYAEHQICVEEPAQDREDDAAATVAGHAAASDAAVTPDAEAMDVFVAQCDADDVQSLVVANGEDLAEKQSAGDVRDDMIAEPALANTATGLTADPDFAGTPIDLVAASAADARQTQAHDGSSAVPTAEYIAAQTVHAQAVSETRGLACDIGQSTPAAACNPPVSPRRRKRIIGQRPTPPQTSLHPGLEPLPSAEEFRIAPTRLGVHPQFPHAPPA